MEFNTIPNPMDRDYHASPQGYLGEFDQSNNPNIEGQISATELGMSVPEGQKFGTLIQTSQNAVKLGAGKIELSTSMGGGQEPVGAEAYGIDARKALREIAKVNQADFVSVHTPAQIANMSGYNPQERSFSDEHRKYGLEEVKKAIDFASDVNGGAVVVHTGEYQRDISDQPWAQNPDGSYKFLNYDEEPGRATLYMVDDRTGKLITEVRKSMVVREPEFETKADPSQGGRMRFVDAQGEFIDESDPDALMFRVPKWDDTNKRFLTRRLDWEHFENRAKEWNKYNKHPNDRLWTPEELYFRSQMETRILQSRGYSLYHGRFYERELASQKGLQKAYDFYKKMEKTIPKEEQWKIMEQTLDSYGIHDQTTVTLARSAITQNKLPSEILKDALEQSEMGVRHTRESSAAADAQAEETIETMKHVVPVSDYAKRQSRRSFADMGIYAMERSKNNPHSQKDVYVAPENIFPEMGYGSHPDELIELVQDARYQMVKQLTQKYIESPWGKRDNTGEFEMVANPDYDSSISEADARKEANQHIKATLDTQHLGMWWKHFQPKPGESKDDRKKRFDSWYMDQVEKLEKADIVGHIHVVDAMGGGHQHLPVGQGVHPVREALEYLKKKGYAGTMISEAHGEEGMHGQGRILTEAWRGLGTKIRSVPYGGASHGAWSDIQHGYFGANQNPYFIFGAYSPSNDWQLWSQVPME